LITIICGETGSGKSTRVPQFLYDHGLVSKVKQSKVVITQPRRIAAISLANRVSDEMNSVYQKSVQESGSSIGKGKEMVGYQVRWQHSKNYQNCGIKFVTDGILLNEMMSDPLLTNYEYVVIDEAHERKMISDVLVGLVIKAGNFLHNINN
jgi:HrpA-like RNA helicase